MKGNKNVTLFLVVSLKNQQSDVEKIVGHATFVDDKTVEVKGQKYTADHIIIATGGRPLIPDIPGKGFSCLFFFCVSYLFLFFFSTSTLDQFSFM